MNLLSLRKNSYQKLFNSYCLWLYRPNAVYATRKGRPISNFDGIWVNGYPFFFIHISIHLYPLFVYKWPIDRFILPIDQTKSVFFHLKVIIKSKKGPPCIFWPAHRSYIRTASSKPDLYIGIQRTHRLYIIWGENADERHLQVYWCLLIFYFIYWRSDAIFSTHVIVAIITIIF